MKFTIIIFTVFLISGCSLVNSTDSKKSTEKTDLATSMALPQPPSEYEKPENWVTYTSEKYGYQVDTPPHWRGVVDGSQKKVNDHADLFLYIEEKAYSPSIAFIVSGDTLQGESKPSLPFVEANKNLVDRGGDAFKYFQIAYGPVTSNRPFITSRAEWGLIHNPETTNYILVGGLDNHSSFVESLSDIEKIILSFRYTKGESISE